MHLSTAEHLFHVRLVSREKKACPTDKSLCIHTSGGNEFLKHERVQTFRAYIKQAPSLKIQWSTPTAHGFASLPLVK